MIELKNISKSFKQNKVIDNFSFSFEKGKINFITGESGRGKTTLLNMMGAIESVDTGTILYDGKECRRLQIFRKTSFIFQNYGLLENERVIDNFTKFDISNDEQEIISALRKVGLTEQVLKQKVYSLSGGEQQRVAIAKALLKESNIILADEPTGNLDKENALNIIDILREIAKDKLVVIVTHNLELIDESKGDFCISL
ncbi:ABC transporter ATP-binding protein [Mollicutes bacterium LVI A0039]|nr:ABC transporter ATP-binding protein [Mollicutes bacterium LVI A0039]